MFAWLDRLSDEGHRSQRVAGWWHAAHIMLYSGLVIGYVCMIAFHFSATQRHWESARKQLPEDPPLGV